jgi:hypothetical protein
MERNIQKWAEVNPADAQKQSPEVEKTASQIRGLVQVLPEYFSHRQSGA